MIRAYKFLLRPTVGQQGALSVMLRDHCSLYNAALQERRDAYLHASKTVIWYGHQSAQLKGIRAFDPDQARWSFSSQQATLRRLDKAFAAFFRRARAGEKPGYPRFRSSKRFDTVDFPKDGDGCRVGHVKVHQHRTVVGKVKTTSVKREGRRWYIILTTEQPRPEPLQKSGSVVGIDLGIANFLADSKGGFVPNPRCGAKAAAKLEAAQQALSRCRRGSKRRRKAAETVARLHRKVRCQRLDHAHKAALDRVRGPQDPRYESSPGAPSERGRYACTQRGEREGRAQPFDR